MYTVSDGPGYVKILKQFLNLVHTESIQPRPRQQLHSSIPLNRIQTPSPSFPPPPQSMVRRQQSCWTPEWAASSSSGQGGAQPGSFLNKGQQPPLGGGGVAGRQGLGREGIGDLPRVVGFWDGWWVIAPWRRRQWGPWGNMAVFKRSLPGCRGPDPKQTSHKGGAAMSRHPTAQGTQGLVRKSLGTATCLGGGLNPQSTKFIFKTGGNDGINYALIRFFFF